MQGTGISLPPWRMAAVSETAFLAVLAGPQLITKISLVSNFFEYLRTHRIQIQCPDKLPMLGMCSALDRHPHQTNKVSIRGFQ